MLANDVHRDTPPPSAPTAFIGRKLHARHRPRLARHRARALLVLLTFLAGALLALVPAQKAHAALPDAWAYGYRDPADPVPAPLHDSFSSAGSVGQVYASSGNTYKLLFPGAGSPKGVVHVTAVSTPSNAPSWCEPDLWGQVGADEQALISCWVAGGGTVSPFPTGFSVTFTAATYTGPSSPDYAYLESDGASSFVTQFDSAGAPISISHLGLGQWQVKVPGVGVSGSGLAGGVTVTGFGSTASPDRCKLASWVNASLVQVFTVSCFNGLGAPADTKWNLTYQLKLDLKGQPGPAFGYFWQHAGAPPLTNFNSMAGWGANSDGLIGPANYTVKYPLLGPSVARSTAQADAFGPGPEFCRFGEPSGPPPWANLGGTLQVASIDCFKATGAPVITDFLTAYASS